jgi:hypothetical protein
MDLIASKLPNTFPNLFQYIVLLICYITAIKARGKAVSGNLPEKAKNRQKWANFAIV